MTKGHHGESCSEAIRSLLRPGLRMTYGDLYRSIKQKGDWKDGTIYQHLMGLVVNLPPARRHWKSAVPFLFLHGDGTYELFDARVHPATKE